MPILLVLSQSAFLHPPTLYWRFLGLGLFKPIFIFIYYITCATCDNCKFHEKQRIIFSYLAGPVCCIDTSPPFPRSIWSVPNPHRTQLIQVLCNPFDAVWFVLNWQNISCAFNFPTAHSTCRGAANLILIHSGGNKQVSYGVNVSCSTNYCRKVIPSSQMKMSNCSLQSAFSALILLILHYWFIWAV